MNDDQMAERQMQNAVERIDAKFSEVPREHVEDLIAEAEAEFGDAKVTDHIPNLVEHEVRDRLREETS